MYTYDITLRVTEYALGELAEADRRLVEAARAASLSSYAPYSGFSVGAAARLADGQFVVGSNQENAAYPSGLCAERVCLFACGAQHAGERIEALAIAARRGEAWEADPVPPCGACRQVMEEVERRQGAPLRVLLAGADRVLSVDSAAGLLPLTFTLERQ